MIRTTHAAFAIASCAFAFSVHANPLLQQMGKAGGTLQAASEACGSHSAAQLKKLKDEQRAALISMGVTGEQFDKLHQASYKEAQAKFAAASKAQKAEICAEMKAALSEK